jgi:hypothetical protein
MDSLKIPRSRFFLSVLPIAFLLAFAFSTYTELNSSQTFLAVGLALDIIGASILAVPDVPMIHKHFFFGKIKNSVEYLKIDRDTNYSNTLVAPGLDKDLIDETYYYALVKNSSTRLNQIEGVIRESDPPTENFEELRRAFQISDERHPNSWKDVFAFKVMKNEYMTQAIALAKTDDGVTKKRDGPYHMVFDPIETMVDELKSRYRRTGLLLLVIGFVFQGLSLL